jgi:hypothetical protein
MLLTADELVANFQDVPLNGSKPANAGFFIRIAFEDIIQGIWNSSFTECPIINRPTKIIDEKVLTKVFQKLLVFNENSEELYWAVLYSLSLRKGSIDKDLTQSKLNISAFLEQNKEIYSFKRRNKIETIDSYGVTHSNSYVTNYTYGRLPKPTTGSRKSDY